MGARPLGMIRMGKVIPIMERLKKRSRLGPGGCRLWIGDKTPFGHGRIRSPVNGRKILVHRLMFELEIGPIPEGMRVLHRCDVPNCFEPQHLFLGTDTDNMRDMAAKGRGYVPRGEGAPMAKLTATAVADLRGRMIEYGSISRWAREFGVSRRAIRLALNGVTWA